MSDKHNLTRFVAAQNYKATYAQSLCELKAGKKRTHWIWFVLPRLIGPGYSTMSTYYALANRWEARAYLKHPVLGSRLIECVETILQTRGSLASIFGPDESKVRQCAWLFASVSNDPIWVNLLCKP